MIISCPFCGSRDVHEFTYLGDATVSRPNPTAPDARQTFYAYVYLRENPAGEHRELWYHGAGCTEWVEVTRDTRTHAISKVTRVRDRTTTS